MAREIEIQLLGRTFNFHLAQEISREEFLQAAEYVENKLKKIKNRLDEPDAFKLGLLAALNIALDLFALKRENDKMHQILEHIDTLISPEQDGEELSVGLSS